MIRICELLHLSLPFDDTFWVGVVLLLIAVGYVALSALHRKPFQFFRWQIPLPPLKLTLYQIVIACGDLWWPPPCSTRFCRRSRAAICGSWAYSCWRLFRRAFARSRRIRRL